MYYVKSSEDVIADSENGIQIYSYDIKTGKTRKIYNARKNTYITSVFVNNNRLFFSEYDYKKENTNIYRHGSDKKIKVFNNQYINVLQQEIKNRNTSFYKYISDNNNETIESYFSIKDGNMSLAQERCNITDNRSILNNYGFYCVNNDGNAIRINLGSKKKENFKLNILDHKRDSLVWFYFFE